MPVKRKRRLKKFRVTKLSLVENAANKMNKVLLMKTGDEATDQTAVLTKPLTLLKTNDEKRVSFHGVYTAEDWDTDFDIVSESALEDVAWATLLSKTTGASIQHRKDDKGNQIPGEAADFEIVESFIERNKHNIYGVKVPTWIVGLKHPETELGQKSWGLVKSGEKQGISLEGPLYEFEYEDESLLKEGHAESTKAGHNNQSAEAGLLKSVYDRIGKFLGNKNEEELTMEQYNELKQMIETLTKSVDESKEEFQSQLDDLKSKNEELTKSVKDKVEEKSEDLAKSNDNNIEQKLDAVKEDLTKTVNEKIDLIMKSMKTPEDLGQDESAFKYKGFCK